MKKRKPPTDTGPKIGDRVRLVPEAPLRNDEMDLQGKTGEIIECTEGSANGAAKAATVDRSRTAPMKGVEDEAESSARRSRM